MTPEQAAIFDAYKAYEKEHAPLKKQVRAAQEESFKQDMSDTLRQLSAVEAAMMTQFVKTARGLQ
jgi:hypothetical protein